MKLEGQDQQEIADPAIDSWLEGLDRENTRRTYSGNLKRLSHIYMQMNGDQIRSFQPHRIRSAFFFS